MSGTVTINADPTTYPTPGKFTPAKLEIMQTWGGTWASNSALILDSCKLVAGRDGISTCHFHRVYGDAQNAGASPGLSAIAPIDYSGWWCRVSIWDTVAESYVVTFIGIIENVSNILDGNSNGPTGNQVYEAMGGLKILDKLDVSESVFSDNTGATSRIGWIPPMNQRDRRGLLVGNMGTAGADVFCYGGTNVWTHDRYLDYLILNFIQQPSGPTWTVEDPSSVLPELQTTINFRDPSTAAKMVGDLVPIKFGVDFYVGAATNTTGTNQGFIINVFPLVTNSITISYTNGATSTGSVTMPASENTVEIDRSAMLTCTAVNVVQSDERKYDYIEIQGKRIVVCGTLAESASDQPSAGSLIACWNSALEAAYVGAGGLVSSPGTNEADAMDAARRVEAYRPVFQWFRAVDNWDHDSGKWALACNDGGGITNGASFQNLVRETLGYVPFNEGTDYTKDPPTVNTETSAVVPDKAPGPIAWVKQYYDKDLNDDVRMVSCEHNEVHVHRPYEEWGVWLQASPLNHVLAYGSDSWPAATADSPYSDYYARFDYTTLVVTLAIHSDHKLRLAYKLTGMDAAGDGSRKIITDESCELWVALTNTVVDVSTNGTLITMPAPTGSDPDWQHGPNSSRILRNDIDRMAFTLAGEVLRYSLQRGRAAAEFKGFANWGYLVGYVCTIIQDSNSVVVIGAPVTELEFINQSDNPHMILKTGYAS